MKTIILFTQIASSQVVQAVKDRITRYVGEMNVLESNQADMYITITCNTDDSLLKELKDKCGSLDPIFIQENSTSGNILDSDNGIIYIKPSSSQAA